MFSIVLLPLYQQKANKTIQPNKTKMKTKNTDQFLIANNFVLLAISLYFLIIHPNNDQWKEISYILNSIPFLFIGVGIRYYYLAFKAHFIKTKMKTTIQEPSPTYLITSKPLKSWKSTAP